MSEAFRPVAVDSPRAIRAVRAALTERRDEVAAQLRYAQNWDDFRRRTGELEGLETALAICDEVLKKED